MTKLQRAGRDFLMRLVAKHGRGGAHPASASGRDRRPGPLFAKSRRRPLIVRRAYCGWCSEL